MPSRQPVTPSIMNGICGTTLQTAKGKREGRPTELPLLIAGGSGRTSSSVGVAACTSRQTAIGDRFDPVTLVYHLLLAEGVARCVVYMYRSMQAGQSIT